MHEPRSFYVTGLFLACFFISTNSTVGQITQSSSENIYDYQHPIVFEPASYICEKLDSPININGALTESSWDNIPWTDDFVDIQGELAKSPHLQTRAKMAWDDNYFYVAAELSEPHIWATLTERDAIMYHDDDFEIFIDPDGDGHNYFEFEMNAFNAIWDLFMLYPYKVDDGRNYIMNWDIRGIKSAVHINGTINDPSDTDIGWTVEVAIPWETFKDFMPRGHKPAIGDQWRLNFSRVDWTMAVDNKTYVKVTNDEGKPLSENNWVWSPTGYINMHKPETWGYIQFSDKRNESMNIPQEEKIKWALWQVYYQVKQCYRDNKDQPSQACKQENFTFPKTDIPNYNFEPQIITTPYSFIISANSLDGRILTLNDQAQLEKR